MRLLLLAAAFALVACDTPDGSTPGLDGSFVHIVPDAGELDAGVDAGLLPFLAPCTDDTQCETMLCFHFNAYGPHCSHTCTAASECEAPSPGCSGMGVCKLR